AVAADGTADAAREALDATAATLAGSKAALQRAIRHGHAAEQIVATAESAPPDLLVVGSHGRSAVARFFMGSTAGRVARHAACPVLLVRPGREEIREVVLGVDDSDCAAYAAEWLARFPLPPGCEVRLVTILPNLREIAREYLLVMPPLTEKSVPLD